MPRRRSPLHRVWQFVQASVARPLTPAEKTEIASILAPAQQSLFGEMRVSDQRHALNVSRALIATGQTRQDLLAAALLHDVGKSRYRLRLSERAAVVVTRRCAPAAARSWGAGSNPAALPHAAVDSRPHEQRLNPHHPPGGGELRGWRRAFIIYEQHPEWGAEIAAAAGCSPLTVWLIRQHQGDSTPRGTPSRERTLGTELLRALRRADNAN